MNTHKFNPLLPLLALLLFGSCTRYLDVKPYGMVIPKTPEEYDALIQPHLDDIATGEQNMILVPDAYTALTWDLYADNFESALRGGNASGLPFWIGSKIELGSGGIAEYGKLYAIIKDANIVIDGIAGSEDEGAKKTLSASYALRAIACYQLMRLYCEPVSGDPLRLGVPIIQVFDTEAQVPRSTMTDLMDVIESDFDKALSYNPEDKDYLFTADVLKGYLARFYHWIRQWEKAAPLAEELLAKYPVLSRDAFVKMMKTTATSGNTLLRVEQGVLSADEQDRFAQLADYPLSMDLISEYSEEDKKNDIRYTEWIDGKLASTKPGFSGLRGAELLLIAAEAEYHLNHGDKALSLINDLRANRITGYTPLTMETLPAIPASEHITRDAMGNAVTPLLSLILTERRKELLMEGDRFFELKRNGRPEFWKASDGYRYDIKSYMYTLPIPLRDVFLQDNLIQNPEYDKYVVGNNK